MKNITWTEAVSFYWLARRRDFSPHTISDYSTTFRRFAEFIDDRPVCDIAARDVHAFLNHVQDTHCLTRKTLSNYWAALSSFWTWAEVELEMPHIMRGRVPRPKSRRREIRPYTRAEVQLILAGCAHMDTWESPHGRVVTNRRPTFLRDRAVILTLVDTGLRNSELRGLVYADYSQSMRQLRVRHGKGDKQRSVYFGRGTNDAIAEYLATRPGIKPSDPLFVARTGRPLERRNLATLIQRLARKAGVLDANTHRFRHTFAINFIRNGGNIVALQDLLGHEDIQTCRLYVRLAEVDLRLTHEKASPVDNWRLERISQHANA